MLNIIQEVRVPVRSETDVIVSQQYGREMAATSGFDQIDQVAIATAIVELARNILDYATTGEVVLRLVDRDGQRGIVVIAHDEGPGISDVERVLRGGYSTSGGLGAGISGTKRLMDEFEIVSEVGKGTTITARKWRQLSGVHEAVATVSIDWAVAARPLPGQQESGDLHLVKKVKNGYLIAVVDGLGHGPRAAAAAQIVVAALDANAERSVVALVELCHRQLKPSQGAALTLAKIDARNSVMTWLGVGNVEAILQRGDPLVRPRREYVLPHDGVVGEQLPPLGASAVSLIPGDTMIMATDGISSRFTDRLKLIEPPQKIADDILAKHGKGTDDALVLVVRFKGLQ